MSDYVDLIWGLGLICLCQKQLRLLMHPSLGRGIKQEDELFLDKERITMVSD